MAAEIIAAGPLLGFGLGAYLKQGSDFNDMPTVIAAIFLILVVGIGDRAAGVPAGGAAGAARPRARRGLIGRARRPRLGAPDPVRTSPGAWEHRCVRARHRPRWWHAPDPAA